ncbi:MAG: HAD family hydrolase [Candidatus Polarisedimenticolaceae bacterium]|nr:HAD family hydrolase [Candidatus Polarisedimenticolaceae bacterium]
MFDIDGTLINSNDFDTECFTQAVYEVIGIRVDDNWSKYEHVTDKGILNEIINTHDLNEQKQKICQEVKKCFIRNIGQHLEVEPAQEVTGAISFLEKLREMNDVVLSIATGGWLESAELKLNSAGINIKNIPVASSNDHYFRTKIMKIAEQRATNGNAINNTYFGDGAWDKKACGELGYNFILVGNNASHSQRIINFISQKEAFEYIGL